MDLLTSKCNGIGFSIESFEEFENLAGLHLGLNRHSDKTKEAIKHVAPILHSSSSVELHNEFKASLGYYQEKKKVLLKTL